MPSTQPSERPPDYKSLPPAALALTPEFAWVPLIYVSGNSRHPDLSIVGPDGQNLYHFETESTLVYHETHVKDLRIHASLFNIRRRPIKDMPEGHWRYTIHSHTPGSSSKNSVTGDTKLLEIDTDPSMLILGRNETWSTRLIFRNAHTYELDGLTLCVTQEGLAGRGMGGEMLYRGTKVADIIWVKKSNPAFEVRIYRDGLDPLLVSICTYVMDDRVMGTKRRNRRHWLSGLPGVGKGPGAGLAGAYALGAAGGC